MTGRAQARPDISAPGPDQLALTRQICGSVIRLQPGEEQFDGCVSSLTDSLRSAGRDRAVRLAHDDCLARGLRRDSPDSAVCVLKATEPEPAQSSRSYFTVTPGVARQREQQACAQLGFDPATGAFANCFADLSSTLRNIDHSADN